MALSHEKGRLHNSAWTPKTLGLSQPLRQILSTDRSSGVALPLGSLLRLSPTCHKAFPSLSSFFSPVSFGFSFCCFCFGFFYPRMLQIGHRLTSRFLSRSPTQCPSFHWPNQFCSHPGRSMPPCYWSLFSALSGVAPYHFFLNVTVEICSQKCFLIACDIFFITCHLLRNHYHCQTFVGIWTG